MVLVFYVFFFHTQKSGLPVKFHLIYFSPFFCQSFLHLDAQFFLNPSYNCSINKFYNQSTFFPETVSKEFGWYTRVALPHTHQLINTNLCYKVVHLAVNPVTSLIQFLFHLPININNNRVSKKRVLEVKHEILIASIY